jgi:hypothetical protein
VSVERLHPDDLRELARLIAAELRQEGPTPADGLVDVRTLATTLAVSEEFVRENAVDLGGFRIRDHPRAPWRFSIDEARERMKARGRSERSDRSQSDGRTRSARRGRRQSGRPAGQILAIRGPAA